MAAPVRGGPAAGNEVPTCRTAGRAVLIECGRSRGSPRRRGRRDRSVTEDSGTRDGPGGRAGPSPSVGPTAPAEPSAASREHSAPPLGGRPRGDDPARDPIDDPAADRRPLLGALRTACRLHAPTRGGPTADAAGRRGPGG